MEHTHHIKMDFKNRVSSFRLNLCSLGAIVSTVIKVQAPQNVRNTLTR